MNRILSALIPFLLLIFLSPGLWAGEMTPSSLVFDDATYTAEMEKDHHKLHMLYGQAFDKSQPLAKREKARREYFKVSQDLIKKMHSRIMTMNVKEGAAMSHTDVLLSTHLLLMAADMLSTIQQEQWANDPGLVSSD